MRLLIVIVNYRTAELVIDCLQSLEGEVRQLAGTRVVVTDNASGDDSAERIRAAVAQHGWGDWVQVMPLPRNGGFAYGNNAAIRPALESNDPPDYFFLLNPDTTVHAGALSALVRFMDAHEQVGIAGSRIENPDGSARRTAFRFHSIAGEFAQAVQLGFVFRLLDRWTIAPPVRDETHRTDWVSGAAMIVRRAVFEQVGLLDEGYFMYYEEVDLIRRAADAGWQCWYVHDSRVVHLVGQASGVTGEKRREKPMPRYWFDSRRRYLVRTHGRLYALAADLAWTAGYACWRLRRWLQRKPDHDPPHFLRDFVRYNFLPGRTVDR